MSIPLRVLLVEDSKGDANLIILELQDSGYDPEFERVDTPEAFSAALTGQTWDVIICDYFLPRFSGLDALAIVQKSDLDLPFIVVSGVIGEDVAVAAIKSGAYDYVMKDNLVRLGPAVRRALQEAKDRRARRQAEEALQDSEERFRATFAQAAVGISHVAPDGRWLRVNQKLCDIVGYTREELMERTFKDITHPDDLDADLEYMRQILEGKIETYSMEKRYIRGDGSLIWINLTVSLVAEPSGDPKYLITVVEDITERKQTEEALRQRNQELALFNRVGQALNSTLDLDQVLATILEEVRRLLGVIASSIWLVDPETDGLVCRQAIGPKNSIVRGWQLPMGEGIAGWVAYHGQSLIVPDVQDDERYFEGVDRRIGLGLRSILCVPLRVRQDVIGVLQVVDTKIARFGERDQALLESLAVPAATAVENARLYKLAQLEIAERKRAEEELARFISQLHTAVEVSNQLTVILEIDQLLSKVVTLLQSRFNLYHVHVYLLNEAGDDLVMRVGSGEAGRLLREQGHHISLNREQSLVARAARTMEIVAADDVHTEVGFMSNPLLPETHSEVAAPLIAGNKVMGVLDLQDNRPHRFTQSDLDTFRVLAGQIAIAVENSRLYAQVSTAKEAAEEARQVAETANQAKSAFLANMSHELRTPLNSILGYAQILKRDQRLTATQNDAVDIIHRGGEHLLIMINDILDLSKIEAEKVELLPSKFHLPDFLKMIARISRVWAEEKGIAFTYEALSPLPAGVYADGTRLRQILLNLLNNAVKFTEQGSVTFRVRVIKAAEEQKTVHFEIEDTGIGISPEKQAEIFLPFYQIGDKHTQAAGTGLGLAISKKLVQMMGGELLIKSPLHSSSPEEGMKGSVFWFDLDLPEVDWQAEPVKIVGQNITGYTSLRDDPKGAFKILIVDDETDNRLVLEDLLEPLGFETMVAVGGRDVLAKATAFQPDLILMDLVMPDMDGFAATKQIRQSSELKDIVVIAISASAFDHVRQESLAAGCNDYIAKPLDINGLLEKLQFHLPLKWIYEDYHKVQVSPTEMAQQPLIPPPQAELAVLFELAMMGDIVGIRERVKQLETSDPKFEPFAARIAYLAKELKVNELEEFIRQCLENEQ